MSVDSRQIASRISVKLFIGKTRLSWVQSITGS